MFGKLFKKKKVDYGAEATVLAELDSMKVSYREFNELREQFLALTNYMGVHVYKPYGYKVEENKPINNVGALNDVESTTFTVAMR